MTFDPARAVPEQEPEFNPERAALDVGPPTRAVLKTAVPFKPDDVAEAARLAARYPAPVDTLYRNLADVRLQAAVDAADERLKTSPKLAEHMRTQPFVAKLAHDDVDRLADLEQFVRDVGGAAKAGVFRASRGAAGTFQAGLELVAPVLDPLEPVTAIGGNPLRRLAEGFAMMGEDAGGTAKAARPKSEGILMGGFFSGIESLTQNVMTLPLAFLNPAAALTSMTAFTGGDAYQDAREKGLPMSQALPFAASQAAIEYATEKLPLGALLKDVKAGAGFLTALGRQIALEVPGEQIATVLQDLNEWSILNPEKPFSSYLEERPSAAAQTLVATIVGTGGNVAIAKGIESVIERATRDGVNMQRAGVMGQALEQAMKGAQASALRERSPEVFRQLMAEMSEDGSLYIDAEVLNQMPADVLQQMEGVAQQLETAAPDTPVAVKVADALTLLPGTPAAEVFMQNARSAPDAPSLLEAETAGKKAAEFLQNEMARVVQEAQDQEAMRASSEAVRQTIAAELNATGRYRPAVSDQMATWAAAFYITMASRVGMTPEQFFQRYRIRVLGAPSQQGDAYNASQPGRLDGVEAYHWSMEARPVLSSAFYGTGLKGSAREEIMSYPDQRIRQRLSFYVDKGTGVRPEAGVGGVAHRVRLDNIYDANADPLRLRGGNAREFESKVLDAGFDGYLDRLDSEQPGQVIMLGQRTLQPEVLGPLSRVDAGQKVPALQRREAPWTVQASGAPEMLQMRLARMQASPAWGNYELKIEGDQLLARDKGGVFEQKAKEPDSNVKLPKKASATVAADIRKGDRLTGKQKMSIHEVAAFFDKITGKRDFSDPKEQARAVKQIVAELKYQMEREKSGLDWYEDDIKAAFEMTAQVIPSLTESATKRQLFAVVAGLQSPGTLADMNWDIAAQTFLHYEKTGQIPGRNPANGNLWAGGPVSANKAKALEFLNAMVQDLGEQGTVEWLYSEHTVKELNEARKKWGNMGPGVDGKASDMKLGMFAFGPKVGPFVMNINGIHELTIDVWATRSFNRYFGQMTGPDGKIIDAPTEPQRRVAKELFNAAAEQVGIKPYQVQSVLWFFEQQLFNHLGTGSASLSFSDGARKFAERSLSAARRDGEAAALQQGGLTDGRSEPTGDGAGRYTGGSLAPLAGAPTVEGAAGPDPRLVAVAEQYARDNGIPLRRQAEYVKVDVERAKRIAQAYDEMRHDPQNPRVREAYADLIRQTRAQYEALVAAGYEFTFFDSQSDPYQGNPWNAMRDLRANKRMAVYGTYDGYGTEGVTGAMVEDNPMLADTGLRWPDQDGVEHTVLANDLFRAVHDAFGHGLEGAGFRAQGEENAWQAHVRLFTGPAVGAITSETRGQNSWLNYGPYGEQNQNAKVEDTVFADQKTGLMPEWTWTEGRAADEGGLNQEALEQGPRGTFNPKTLELVLNENADLSTWFHETGHFFLEVLADIASQPGAPAQIVEDMNKILAWFGIKGDEQVGGEDAGGTLGQSSAVRLYHGSKQPIKGQFRASSKSVNTTTFGDVDTERTGVFFSDNPEFSAEYGDVAAYDVSIESTAEVTRDLILDFAETIDPFGPERDLHLLVKNTKSWGMFEGEVGRRFVAYLQEQGYDSATFQEDLETEDGRNVESNTTVVFDPERISPATLAQGGQPTQPQPIQPKRTPLETWNAMTLDQKRPYHERWAESVEQYVMEGKAPSTELAPLMRRFAAWLKSVYGSIKQFLAARGVGQGAASGEVLGQAAAQTFAFSDERPAYNGMDPTDRVSEVQLVPVANVEPTETPDPEKVARMVDAMRRGDALPALVVEYAGEADSGDDLLAVVDGHHRLAAAAQLGYAHVPVRVVVQADDWPQVKKYGGLAIKGGVYAQDLAAQPGPPMALNDDIRRVMDRMLATDEQIAQAEEIAGMVPDEEATNAAADRLRKRSMADLKFAVKARDQALKELRKQAAAIEKKIRAEVTAEVNARPEVQANEMLAKTRQENKRELNDVERAVIADAFGYESVDAMLQAIAAFGNKADVIDGMTEQRMLEEHGDLVDERAISEAANEAVHNAVRQRVLASELRTQAELMSERRDTGETNARGAKITVNALVEAAKQFGAKVAGRTVVRDLKATAWKHTAAERRAGRRYTEMTAAGKTLEAVEAKRDQVLQNAAAKAVLEAQAEARKIVEFFRKVAKGNDEKVVEKGRDPDIVNAARAVLAAYGLETPTTKAAGDYLETLQRNDPDTYAAIQPMMAVAMQNAQPLESLTFEELQGLHEQVEAMWHLAKRSRQMEVDGDLLDIDEVADEVYAKLEEIGIPDTLPGETGALTRRELFARQWLQQGPALLRRVEQWAEAKDGKFGGPFLRFIFQPVKDAADRYRTDRLAYRKKFQALVDNIAPTFTNKTIEAPELNYTFGKGHNGVGHAELLHALLHTGNESNKRKLLLGRGWAAENADGTLDTSRWDTFLKRMYDTGVLEKAHWDFVQGVWDLMEETKPLAQKTHRDVFGRYFAEITADPVETPFGTYRGGYVPAQADPLLVQDADLRELLETENAGMAQAFPQTNRGFTKSRVEYNRPLKLDLRTLPQHIDKVLLFSHMEPAVRGVARLLRRPKVSQPLGRVDPAAMGGLLKPWLNRAARQTVETPMSADAGLNRLASTVRGRVGMALMFANVSNTLQQITGAFTASLKVKPSLMRRATAQFIRNPAKFKESVWQMSPYMADRASNEVAVLSDTLEAILINPTTYQRAEQFTRRHAYFLQTAFDNAMSPIIWSAAYNQALAEGMDERMAIRFADGTIRQTQGSTLPEDVSRIETGPAYARLFTQFVGYFNMVANTNATAVQQIFRELGLKKGAGKAAVALLVGLAIPIWVAEAIALGMRGGPDDEDDDGYLDDWLASVFGFGTIKGILSGVPFLGAVGQSVVNRFNDQPADDKFSLSPTVSVLESAAGAPASVYKAIVDDASAQKAVRDTAALITVMTGLPAMAAARPIGYGVGVADGEIEPTGPADAARGLITGTASPESKQ